jgi:hypothetical protein
MTRPSITKGYKAISNSRPMHLIPQTTTISSFQFVINISFLSISIRMKSCMVDGDDARNFVSVMPLFFEENIFLEFNAFDLV